METTNIMALYGEAIDTITKDGARWAHFLDTAARIYKHNFINQIIIYEQNPDVTACGTKEQWERFGRKIKKDAKQIGTLRTNATGFMIDYVYDVSDTEDNGKRLPSDWNISEENEKNILDMLKIGHDAEYTDTMTLKGGMQAAVELLSAERFQEVFEQFLAICEDSWIGKEPDEVVNLRLRSCIEDTAEYMVLKRCGFDVGHIEFNRIHEFDTLQTISVLGIAACGIARDVLVEIEKEARKSERSVKHDRTGLYGRSRRDIEAPARSTPDHSTAHEVRIDAKEISGGTDERGLPVLAGDGQPIQSLQGSGDQGAGYEGAAQERLARGKQTAGDGGFHGNGGLSERDRPPGGGNSAKGDRIQQGDPDDHHEEEIRQDGTEPEEEKSSGFSISGSFKYQAGDEVFLEDDRVFKVLEITGEKVTVGDVEIPLLVRIMERPDFETLISGNEKNKKKPVAKITQEDIDEVLRGGSKAGIRQYDIYSHFTHDKNIKNNAGFLKDKYGWSGQTWDFSDGSRGVFACSTKGIEIKKFDPEIKTLLKWPAAAKRIKSLIAAGKYLTETEIALISDYEEWVRLGNLYRTFEHTMPTTEEKSIEFAKALNRYNLSTGSLVYINGTELQISKFGAECYLSAEDEDIFIDQAELKSRLTEDERNDYLLDLKDLPDFEAMGINQETAVSFQKWLEIKGIKHTYASLSPEKLDDIFDEYSPLFVSKILFDEKYMEIREGFRDAEAAREECGAAVKRIAATMGSEKELQRAFNESESFRDRLVQYVFQQTYTSFEERQRQADMQTGQTEKTKSRLPMDAPHVNYRKMQKLFPAIMDGTCRYMQFGAGEAFDPLHVGNYGDGMITLSHTYEQNGDVMYDPRMELRVDHKEKTIEAASFENRGFGLRQDVYPEEGKYIPRLRKELNSFLKQWLKNIGEQGYEPVRATIVRDGEDVEITEFESGKPVIPAMPEREQEIKEAKPETKIVKFPFIPAEGKLTAPPYVRIVWSEHPIFEDGEKLSVAEAEYLFRELDNLIIKARQDAAERGERVNWPYFKTRFSVVLEIDGQEEPLETRYSFGDGQGSLTEIFRSDAEQMLNDPHLRNNLTSDEIEAQESILSQFVPYLEQFTELAAQNQMKLNTRLAEYRTEEAARNFLGLDEPKPDAEYKQISEEEFKQAIKQQQQETAAIRPEKKYELGFGYLGNGLTVWNRLEEEHGDYKTIAHIGDDGSVDFYEELPQPLQNRINDEAKKHRDAKEFELYTLSQEDILAYYPLRDQYPDALLGFQVGAYYAFYGDAAEKVSQILKTKCIVHGIVGENYGENAAGFPVDQWVLQSKKLWAAGNDVVLYGYYGGEKERSLTKHLKADEYIPLGMKLNIEGKEYIVESVDFAQNDVGLEDISHEFRNIYISIRHERIEVVRQYVEEQQWDEQNLTNPEPQPEQPQPDNQQEPIWTPIEGGEVTQVMIDLAPSDEKEQKPEKINYRITDEHYGEATAKMRLEKNMDAIFILREVENENRLATPEEQEILAGYTGWGAIPQAFDENNERWSKEYERLKDELSPEEYHSARASVLNAHYTTPVVIRAVYKALENMGLEGGNICDPACGIGNFFGAAPESLERAKFYGVELDSLTARIAKQLYQKVDIRQSGFEETDFEDGFFDVFVGNVPFGSYKVADQRYARENFLIHDYFFARALDKVRPGGVVAFLTSKGTLDKGDPTVRKYLAERAELLGAIRLPNNAFKANAGTEVTIDILFLQKRERRISIEPDWVHLDKTGDGIPVNSYFADHPEMVLGKMEFWANMYGKETDTACLPIEGADLSLQLEEAIQNIEGEIVPAEPVKQEKDTAQDTIPADPTVKNFCYTVFENKIYYREDAEMHRMYFSANTDARVRGLCKIREVVRELIDAQMYGHSDEKIKAGQQQLNFLYDSFVKKHGRINSRGNSLAFRGDTDYPLLCSLEILDEEDHFKEKAAFFSKRTIRPPKEITSAQTAQDALIASMAERGRVDLPYMETLYHKDKQQIISELHGQIFKNPASEDWVLKDEYLSGNVRKKLAEAQEAAIGNPEYTENIEALLQVQPEDIPAEEIDVKIGSIWVPPEDYKQFILETLQLKGVDRVRLSVDYSQLTGGWRIQKRPLETVLSSEVFGTNRKNAYEIMEAALNLRLIEVRDRVEEEEGKVHYVLNAEDTIAAQSKQSELQEKFREWIFEDTERRERLVRKYNDQMNNIVPRQYDGKYIRYHGMNPEISMRDYQRNVDARILYGGNTLIGHVVGSGKTYEIIAAVQEKKYLGLCHKAMICVPNHLLMQWASDYLRLYPAANILVVTAKDFEKERRRKFCARIATGEYDAVIIGHSQLAKIPMSKEWEQEHINDQIDEIMEGIAEAKARNDEHWSIKRMEGMRKNLEERLKRLNAIPRDNVLDFEELGVDMLVVDESQEFKNLMFNTKMRNVAGVSQANSKRASDLYMKCRYLDKITGNRGVVFATGTPISNTIAEMYTIQRYLQYEELEERGLTYFDAWVSVFAEVRTTMELAPSGRGFRLKTRLSTYYNIEELSNMFALVADIKTAEDIQIPVPKIRGGEPENVVISPSVLGEKLIGSCVERTERIRKKLVRPDEDNMLLVTNDGRKIALDVRCYDPSLPDEDGNKVSVCAEKVYEIWEESTRDRAAQLVFCDQSTPKSIVMKKNEQGEFEKGEIPFSIYADLKEKLVAKGIPAREIAFIHEANSDAKKAKLFAKVRKGTVRVLIGSTFMMGAGTNVQDRLVALHHLDAPWRPSDLTQREGRILRWGNMFPEVRILRYLTERSFDAYIYQLLENKQRFTNQIISNKPPARRMDDVDVVSEMLKQIKAIATGDPRVIRKSELDTEIMRVQVLKRQYKAKRFRLQSRISGLENDIARNREWIRQYEQDIKTIKPHLASGFKMTIQGKEYIEKKEAGKALHKVMPNVVFEEGAITVGAFLGLDMKMGYKPYEKAYFVSLNGAGSYGCEIKKDEVKDIERISALVGNLPAGIKACEDAIKEYNREIEDAKAEIERPFEKEQELQNMMKEVGQLNIELNLDQKDEPIVVEEEPDVESQSEEQDYEPEYVR